MKVNKRFRKPTPKAGELLVQYGKIDGDVGLQYCWPENTCGMKRDTRILMWAVEQEPIFEGKTLRELLIERGYDITTSSSASANFPTNWRCRNDPLAPPRINNRASAVQPMDG